MRISDWSSDVCSSDLYVDCERHAGELAQGLLAPDGPGSGESSTPAGCQRVAGRQDAVARCLERWARGRPDRRHSHGGGTGRSEEHTSELQSLMRISYAVFCLKKKKYTHP